MAIATMLIALAIFAGIPNLKLDTDGRVFMAADNPDEIISDRFEQKFARDENLAIIVMPKDGEILTPAMPLILGQLLPLGHWISS
ncbi:MAG: hypothetical protein ISQ26_04745 [Candidatus Puniceispirillum sp.]|nr:hypothetical protein [Candidatus Puniceispirillum sp.]